MSFRLKGRRSKTRANYRKKQHTRFEGTKPELIVFGLLDILGYEHIPHGPILTKEKIAFNPDTAIPSRYDGIGNMTKEIIVEVDGPYHRTARQRQKTKWRDGLLIKAGYRVIHIPSELTVTQKLRDYLKVELKKAIESKEPIVNIVS